jgi:hypothetical protein
VEKKRRPFLLLLRSLFLSAVGGARMKVGIMPAVGCSEYSIIGCIFTSPHQPDPDPIGFLLDHDRDLMKFYKF